MAAQTPANTVLSGREIRRLLKYAGRVCFGNEEIQALRTQRIDRNPVTLFSRDFASAEVGAEGLEPWPSEIGLREEERLIFGLSESYGSCVAKMGDLRRYRGLFCSEECGFHVDNSFMEFFCGFRRVEELIVSDTEHHLTGLPSPYLGLLRHLFICNDRAVHITDEDLAQMPNLELLELSHNNEITDAGILSCRKLRMAKLYNNVRITEEILTLRPELELITGEINVI